MKKSPINRSNSSFGSIREARSCNVPPDATDYENPRTQVIDTQALRRISGIVGAIKQRIEAADANTSGHDEELSVASDPGGSTTAGSNRGKDNNQEETQ